MQPTKAAAKVKVLISNRFVVNDADWAMSFSIGFGTQIAPFN